MWYESRFISEARIRYPENDTQKMAVANKINCPLLHQQYLQRAFNVGLGVHFCEVGRQLHIPFTILHLQEDQQRIPMEQGNHESR